MARLTRSERGVSLIAAMFLLVVVAFLGTTVVSLLSTQTMTSVGETRSTQAMYVAEGGAEFGQRALAQNLDWYRSTTDPIVTPAAVLGAGTFTVNSYLPATLLRRRVTSTALTIPVFSVDRFPASGTIQLDDDIGGGEFVAYTSVTASPASFNLASVAGRDATIGGVNGGAAGTFQRGTHVYPVTTLIDALPAIAVACNPTPAASFRVAAHAKFLSMGTISVDSEEISYTGSNTVGGNTTLTGVTRCTNSQSSGLLRSAGYPVTPILNDDSAPDYEAFMVATGTVGNAPLGAAVRVVQKTVQR
jgi:hypothetical protein